jgi:ClpP class serine protease
VWSGTRAKDVGLVDELGGLHEAILDAASRAGLSDRRAPSLVSLRGNGELLDLLGPGARTDLQRLDALLTPLDPLLLVAAHPEVGVWALDPAWMDEGPR